MKREKIKALIELSTTYEEADEIIDTFTSCKDFSQKFAYIQEMFNCEIVSIHVEDEETDYMALLTSIVDKKCK